MEIMEGKSFTVHYYEWMNSNTSVAFLFQVSLMFVEFTWALSFKIWGS